MAVHEDDQLLMRHARLKPDDLLALLHDELLLCAHVFVRLLLEEELLQNVEEAERIELEEVAQELFIREEAHDVVDVAPPLEGAKRAGRELLPLHEEAHHPEQLVADVRPTMFNVQLNLPVLDVDFLLLQLFSIVLIHRLLVQLAVECLRLKDARSLTLHVVWQFDDILASLHCLVTHHEIEERAKDANADGRIIALIVVEESCE